MTRKNIVIAALLSVTAIGGGTVAAHAFKGDHGPMRADSNGDGIVSRSEFFAAADARFKKRDANTDRTLSGDEMKDRGGRFARQDANNDGTLSYTEAAASTAAQFGRRDVNGDGKLTVEELGSRGKNGRRGGRDFMQAPDGPAGGALGAMLLRRADTNNDGKISRDEYRAQADQRFDRLDTNKDGAIDQAELQAQRGMGGGLRGRRGPGGANDMPPPADGE
ncbi:MAG: EF-hand domain-containing protein [Pseudomonadota bacterium]